jgi:citrate synthase
MIGKASEPVSHIAQAYPDRVEVRGRDLTRDLMGRLTFTEYFHLLLISLAEHGMMPTNVAARMTLAADPGSLHGAVAAGILGCGPVILGTAQECAKLLVAGGDAGAVVAAARAEKRRLPGFGHPVHKPLDPRAERIVELADERGVAGDHVAFAKRLKEAAAPLTMNVSLPIAAVMLDLGFPPSTVKAVPILARTAGLLAHLAEEQTNALGFLMAGAAEEAIRYER